MLPQNIFFTGVPGSRWSGISQIIEEHPDVNTSDRISERTYNSTAYSGHVGAYFGKGMEFEAIPSLSYISDAWANQMGTKIIKSHDWAYHLDHIKLKYPEDWIMMVYRPNFESYSWWLEAGGFNITYPSYKEYKDHVGMMSAIAEQNKRLLEFGSKHNAVWEYFSTKWCEKQFGHSPIVNRNTFKDILVTIIK